MLELRPNCELCDKNLPPQSLEARICTYECTFCVTCVENVLHNVCPNCGGGFTQRPVRPSLDRRKGVSLKHQMASTERVNTQMTDTEISNFTALVKDIKPEDR